MADTQTQLDVASISGARHKSIQLGIDLTTVAGDATIGAATITFDKAFVNTPQVIGGPFYTDGDELLKGNMQITALSELAMTVSVYQVLEADVASGTYNIKVNVVGYQVA